MAQKADSETLKLDSDHRRWPCRREVNKLEEPEESLDHAGVSIIRVLQASMKPELETFSPGFRQRSTRLDSEFENRDRAASQRWH